MGWTNPRTWVAGETVTAAQLNAHVRDNLNALYGSVSTAAVTGATDWTVSSFKYRLMGQLVAVEMQLKYTGAATITVGASGNFADSTIADVGAVPAAIRPTTNPVYWTGHEAGTTAWFGRISTDGSLVLTHGIPTATLVTNDVIGVHHVYALGF